MIQNLEPVVLDHNTPEPKEDGIYIIHNILGAAKRDIAVWKRDGRWNAGLAPCTWEQIQNNSQQYEISTIQPLTGLLADVWDTAYEQGVTDTPGGYGDFEQTPNPYEEQNK
ncbi:hypothetical protein [Bifidobacterium sp.]|uniref:hypothetical protein n=1 Tax=Bifidobacterium sp. TaxID=41200 RepID=UPI0039E93C35